MEALLKAKAKADTADLATGSTALHAALSGAFSTPVRELEKGMKAGEAAVAACEVAMVLLEANADPWCLNRVGLTCMRCEKGAVPDDGEGAVPPPAQVCLVYDQGLGRWSRGIQGRYPLTRH